MEEILEILEEGSQLTCSEISNKTDCSERAVRNSIKRLLKDVTENLEFRILTKEEKENRYGHKISCEVRIFWLEK